MQVKRVAIALRVQFNLKKCKQENSHITHMKSLFFSRLVIRQTLLEQLFEVKFEEFIVCWLVKQAINLWYCHMLNM